MHAAKISIPNAPGDRGGTGVYVQGLGSDDYQVRMEQVQRVAGVTGQRHEPRDAKARPGKREEQEAGQRGQAADPRTATPDRI